MKKLGVLDWMGTVGPLTRDILLKYQLFLFAEQLDQLEVCLPYSRLLTGIPILEVFQNLRWNSNKTSLVVLIPLELEFQI